MLRTSLLWTAVEDREMNGSNDHAHIMEVEAERKVGDDLEEGIKTETSLVH